MKITSVIVDGVGKFGTRSEVTGLGSGVNILAAGNEAGKSTLFRAVRACLFERHNSKTESIRNLATDGLSLPVTVTLGFEHADQAYAITKSFMKNPSASLTRAGIEVARGREADEKLWELLGIAPGSGRSVDESAFGILWVGQGQSFKVPEPSDAATTVLNTAIQAEVGSLVGGERARAVLAALREELAQLVTDTGRPKAGRPLADAMARLELQQKDMAELETRLSVLDGQLVELGLKRSERARLSDPASLMEMARELEAAQTSLKAGEGATALFAQFDAAEQRSKAILASTRQLLANLEDRRARIDADRVRDNELREALQPLEAKELAAREAISAARGKIAEFDAQAVHDEEQERGLQHLAGVLVRANAREPLLRRQEGLTALGSRLVTNTAALAHNRVTAAALTSLDEIEREIATLTARLEAAAPVVAVELGEASSGKVWIGNNAVTANAMHAAIDPLTIRVGDLASITVTPPMAASAADQKKRHAAQKRLSGLIEELGLASASDLRAARARHEGLEAQALAIIAELRMQGIADASPATTIEQIKTEIQTIDTMVTEALAQMKATSLPSAEEILQRQNALRLNREEARRQRQTLDGAIEGQNRIVSHVADARGRIGGMMTEIRNRLEADLAILPDPERASLIAAADQKVKDAQADYQIKAAALEEQRQKAPSPDELERLQTRVTRILKALDNHKTGLGTLDRAIANLEGQIQSAGGDGLGEKVEELRQASALTQREAEKYQGRVDTLQLLKNTIEACYTEQRDRLHAPLRRHLKPFLNDVFPAAEIELGEGFSIAGFKRSGPSTENFERLSAGTQEQIAVLVRLAMGAMICDRGQPVPIILDDALVFSDDDRIGQMFDALNRAGLKQQVIVLTCRTRAFAMLGGQQLTISTNQG